VISFHMQKCLQKNKKKTQRVFHTPKYYNNCNEHKMIKHWSKVWNNFLMENEKQKWIKKQLRENQKDIENKNEKFYSKIQLKPLLNASTLFCTACNWLALSKLDEEEGRSCWCRFLTLFPCLPWFLQRGLSF